MSGKSKEVGDGFIGSEGDFGRRLGRKFADGRLLAGHGHQDELLRPQGKRICAPLKKGIYRQNEISERNGLVSRILVRKGITEKLEEIETLFRENPAKQRQFEQSGAMVKPAVQSWFLSCEDNQAEEFARKLESLPETFTQGKFFRFVHEIGLRKYMKDSAREIKYTLRIFCYPWEVDQNYNQLYFRPTIEDENGKAV